jgi:hypothetical protein
MANNYYKNIITTIIVLMLLASLLIMGVKTLNKSDNIPSEPKIVKQGNLGDDIHPRRYFIYEYYIDGEIYYDMEIID